MIEILGASGSRDDRGLIEWVVPYVAKTQEEIFDGMPMTYAGCKEVSRTWTTDNSGTFIVTVTFQGAKSTSGDAPAGAVRYSMTTGETELPVEAHPKIKELMEKYGGQEDPATGKVTFPQTYQASKGGGGLLGGSSSTTQKNPFYGVEKYIFISVTWTKSYIQATLPKGILKDINTFTGSPPGNPPEPKQGRKWKISNKTATQRGNVWEVTEEYQLQPEDTPSEMYQAL